MTRPQWQKSSYSASEGNCVEVRRGESTRDVRDTKHRASGHVSVSPGAWRALLGTVRQ